MKAVKFAVITLMFSILLPLSKAHATFFSPYANLYTVGSQGSTTAQTDFYGNQLPYLYVQLPNTPPTAGPAATQLTFTAWQDPSASNIYSTVTNSTANQIWVSFSQSYWNSIENPGTWNITAVSFNATTGIQSFGQTSFQVNAVPEPVGTVLFLTGALIMGIGILRRQKAIVA